MGKLWRDYAGKHESVITKVSQTTIRNCAYRVSQEEYLDDRENVQDLLHAALTEKLGMCLCVWAESSQIHGIKY